MRYTKPVWIIAAGVCVILVVSVLTARARSLRQEEPPPTPQVETAPGEVASPASAAIALSPVLQYQGRLTNPGTGQPIADSVLAMTFRLYDVATGGAALWTEAKNVQVTGGLFSTALGDSTPIPQGLFDGRALWLGVTVGADLEASPRQAVLPVAYALSLVPGAVISASNTAPVLSAQNTATTVFVTSTASSGLLGGTASGSAGTAGVFGIGGTDAGLVSPAQESGVLGKAAQGFGVSGVSGASLGVYGYSASSTGVRGESFGSSAAMLGANFGTGYGGYFYAADNYGAYFYGSNNRAIYAGGAITATGNIKSFGEVRGAYTALPIAYGYVGSNGATTVASPNVSSVWSSGSSWYEITISGHSYFYNQYVTEVTLESTCGAGNSARTASVGGNLLVMIYTTGGSSVQCAFQFVTYKP